MTGLIQLLRLATKHTAIAAGLGAALALSAPVIASAQDDGGAARPEGRCGHGFGHHRGRRAAHRFERMSAALGLTDAQQAQVRSVFAQARRDRQEVRDLTPEERRPAMRALHQRVRDQIQGILTPEQQAQARALRTQHAEARMNHRIERMREQLGLTPAQETQIRGIFEQARTERQQLAQGQLAPEQRREASRAIRQRTRDAVRQALTPAQQSELDQHHGRRHHRRFGRGR